MEEFVKSVDETAPKPEQQQEIMTFLAKVGVSDPSQLEGITDADVEKECRAGNAVASAKRLRTQAPAAPSLATPSALDQSSALDQYHQQAVIDLVGAEASAETISRLLLQKNLNLDLGTKLKAVTLDKLPYALKGESVAWKVMLAESVVAQQKSRHPFSYVDFTAKDLLPDWLPQDVIGGRSAVGAEWQGMDASMSASTLGKLGEALRAATATPRFFRSVTQWLACWSKYAVMAVTAGHLIHAHVITYQCVIAELAEHQRVTGGSTYLPILYDDLFRRSIERRVVQQDTTLDFDKAWAEIDKRILALAQARLDSVLNAAGLGGNTERHGSWPEPSYQHVSDLAESLLAKQQAAAETTPNRAETATRALAKQQEELAKQQSQSNNASTHGQYPHVSRNDKKYNWFGGYMASNKGKNKGDKSNGKGKGRGKGKYYW